MFRKDALSLIEAARSRLLQCSAIVKDGYTCAGELDAIEADCLLRLSLEAMEKLRTLKVGIDATGRKPSSLHDAAHERAMAGVVRLEEKL